MTAAKDILNYAREGRTFYGQGTETIHRTAITATDYLAALTLATIADVTYNHSGTLHAGTTYKCGVATGNYSGPGAMSNILSKAVSNDGFNDHILRLTVPQGSGSTFYDIFFSTDAAPKFLARITEAQRLSGCVISAQNTVIAGGGGAGFVDIRLAGTGSATNAQPYTGSPFARLFPSSTVDCTGYPKALVLPIMATTVPETSGTLTLSAWAQDADGNMTYLANHAFSFLDVAADSLSQYWAVDVYGTSALAILVDVITGTSANVEIVVTPVGY